MALATLAQVKSYIGITASDYDAQLTMMLAGADEAFKLAAGQRIEQAAYPAVGDSGIYSGDNQRYLFTRQGPLLASPAPTVHLDYTGLFGDNPDGAYAATTLLVLGTDYSIDWDNYVPVAAATPQIWKVLVGTVVDTAVFTVVVNGTTFTSTATGASTATTVALALQTAIAAALSATVTATVSAGLITLTGVANGVAMTVTASVTLTASILASKTQEGSDGTPIKCSMAGKLERIGMNWPGVYRHVGNLTRNPSPGRGEIKVTYTGGYPVVPALVTNAVCQLTAWLQATAERGGGLTSEKFEEYAYTLDLANQGMSQIGSFKNVARLYGKLRVA